jgi:hypothetical protein
LAAWLPVLIVGISWIDSYSIRLLDEIGKMVAFGPMSISSTDHSRLFSAETTNFHALFHQETHISLMLREILRFSRAFSGCLRELSKRVSRMFLYFSQFSIVSFELEKTPQNQTQ